MTSMNRREFLKTSGEAAAVVTLGSSVRSAAAAVAKTKAASKTIAIQVGAVSFIDEGVETVLDILQERAGVNTIMPVVFSYSTGTAGRHKPNPGHGNAAGSTSVKGGNFATVHPSFYRNTGIEPLATQAPDHPGFDVLAQVLPSARKRGMKVIGMIKNEYRKDQPGIEKLQEYDFNGQRANSACMNNPYFRNFLAGLVDDYMRSYDVDGLMFDSETQGAFSNTLGSRHRGRLRGQPGTRTCFCEHCKKKAREQGIRVERVVPAFEELAKFAAAGRARQRPVDGYYVSLWRLLLRYPELLQWEHLYHESLREVYRLLHSRVKAAKPDGLLGLHIWINHSMSPIYRAEQDFSQLADCADFLKLVVYHNCGGPRMGSYIQSVGDTIYGDVPPEELLQFHYRILNYREAPSLRQLCEAGLSADYVYRESKRAMDGLAGRKTKVFAGIDVDVPIQVPDGFDESKATTTSRSGVRDAVKGALKAGVDGIVISRKYSEMKLDNLSGIGDAVRDARLSG